MQTIRIAYSTGVFPIGPLVKLFTWSKWSHVVLLTDENTGIEATVLNGVQEVSFEYILNDSKELFIVEYEVVDSKAIIEAARSQIGKKYDFTALIGILFHHDWADEDKWFCSELVAFSFMKGGSPLFRKDSVNRITPEDLWKCKGSDIGKVK